MNDEYKNVTSHANKKGLHPQHLYQILVDHNFLERDGNDYILLKKGEAYGKQFFKGKHNEHYVKFKKDILENNLVKNEINAYYKALEEQPEKEQNAKAQFIDRLKKDGYSIEDNPSMNFVAIKNNEIIKYEFKKSEDDKIVTNIFSWTEIGKID